MNCIQSCSSSCNADLEGWRRDDWGIGAEKRSVRYRKYQQKIILLIFPNINKFLTFVVVLKFQHLQSGTTNGFLVLLVLEEPELIKFTGNLRINLYGWLHLRWRLLLHLHHPTFQLEKDGVGSTIGAGVYILMGTLAREHSGSTLAFSFLIAGIEAALSAFCYAELVSRCPSAGSVYLYSYICVGEGLSWIIGWALILENTIGGSAVARGISPNLALLFGASDSFPPFLARYTVPALGIAVDPCASILVFIVTALLCVGIKEVVIIVLYLFFFH
ncbi:hypothetical protein Hanom_Chr15g01349781 [Helianthus anomalus]